MYTLGPHTHFTPYPLHPQPTWPPTQIATHPLDPCTYLGHTHIHTLVTHFDNTHILGPHTHLTPTNLTPIHLPNHPLDYPCTWPLHSVWVLNRWVGQVGGWSSGCVVQVCVCGQSVWPKCVYVCVWPKCVQGSSGWVVIWVAGQVGGGVKWVGGQVGVWPKCVCVKVCGQSVCMCVWPKWLWVLNGWVVK